MTMDSDGQPLDSGNSPPDPAGSPLDSSQRPASRSLGEGDTEQWRYAIFDTTLESIIVIDEYGKIVGYNQAAEELFGFRQADAIGSTMSELIVPLAFRAPHEAALSRYRETQQAHILGQRLELPAIRADGVEIPVELTVIRVDVPGPIRFAGYLRDLTERRRAEEALRLTQFTVDRAAYAVFWLLKDGRISYVNDAACEWLGYSREELLDLRAHDLSPDYSQDDWALHWSRLVHEGSLIFEQIAQRKDGSRFPLQITANYVEFQGKEYNCAIAMDISERQRAERALRDSERKLRGITDAALDAVVLADPEGRVAHWNPAAERMFGYTAEEMLARSIHDVLTPMALRGEAERGWNEFTRSGRGPILGTTRELTALHKNGTEFSIELSISAVELEGRWWAVGVLRDITDRKRFEARLKQALNEAQVANRAKTDFLALISHEMRTPLNGIMGTVSLLSETRLDDEQQEFVKNCRNAAHQLANLIDDLLDFSQIEAGKLELRDAPFPLRELTGQLASAFGRQARHKDLEFRYSLDDQLPVMVVGDGVRLRQILENLLANALKFTDQGFIELRANVLSREASHIRLQFSVADTGIGIAPENRERIFHRFEQVDGSSTRRFGGIGLGLAICSQLVQMLGGEIHVSDGPRGGSLFTFTARFRLLDPSLQTTLSGWAAAQLQSYMQSLGRPLRVLVAEDDELSRKVATRFLDKVGCEVTIAVDGAEALLRYGQMDGQVDLVLMDMMMPRMGGPEATAGIRRLDAGRGRRVPIVALTAQAMKGDRQKCLEADMDGFVAKPVDRDHLFQVMLSLLPELEAPPADPPPAAEERIPPAEIFDIRQLLDRCSNDREFTGEIVKLFLDSSRQLVDWIREATGREDRPRLIEVAHRYKGSVSNMCAPRAFASALEMEELARDDASSWTRLVEQADRLQREWRRLCETLERDFPG